MSRKAALLVVGKPTPAHRQIRENHRFCLQKEKRPNLLDLLPHYRGRLRKRTTKHANGWRVRLNPKKLRRKRQTRQETALI